MKIKVLLIVLLVGVVFIAGFSVAHNIAEEKYFGKCIGSLSVRVRHLERVVAGKLSTTGVPPDLLEDFLYVEEIKREESTAGIQRVVHSRILEMARGLRAPREF